MQVNLSFDTENERIENLKKLVTALQQLVAYREGNASGINRPQVIQRTQPRVQQPTQQPVQPTVQQSMPQQIQQPPQPIQEKKEEKKQADKTSGGCRVIPYEDMSEQMSKLFSQRRL